MAKITGVLQLKHLKTVMDYLRSDFVALKAKTLDKAVKINGVDFDGAKDIEVGFPPSVVVEYEDSFFVKDGENRTKFALEHIPTGKIKLFIDGLRYFNGNNKADELYTYDKNTNIVTWTNTDDTKEGFQLSDMNVVFEYSYSKNEKKVIVLADDGMSLYDIYSARAKDKKDSIYPDNIEEIHDTINVSALTKGCKLFHGFKKLKRIPNVNMGNLTNMVGMFQGCSSIAQIPDINTNGIQDTSYMFAQCENLFRAPKIDTSQVKNMDHMFANCDKLVEIPDLDTSKVKNMNGMFMGCNSLVKIHKIETSNVKNFDGTFYGCNILEKIDSEIDMGACNALGYTDMFQGCKKLSEVKLKNVPKDFNPVRAGLKEGQYTILSYREK